MNLSHSIYIMAIFSFFIQFFGMSLIMTNDFSNITFSLGKFYISTIMALLMAFVEIVMHDMFYYHFSTNYYLIVILSLAIIIYSYRNQYYIGDKEFLKEMIEHHSMALLTTDEIMQKTENEYVKKLAENINSTQQNEINYMKKMLQMSAHI